MRLCSLYLRKEGQMYSPQYVDLNGARKALEEIGIHLSRRQMKRAAEMDAHGHRKLPFFIDPIDKRLKIEKGRLLEIYTLCQIEAEKNSQINKGDLTRVYSNSSEPRKD